MTPRGQVVVGTITGLCAIATLMAANVVVAWLAHSDAVGIVLLAGVMVGAIGSIVWCALHLGDPR